MIAPETHDLIIAGHLTEVRTRIEAACERSGRRSFEVTLVAVTKLFPSETIRKACALGLAHFGENRVQELIEKFGDGSIYRDYPEVQLHLIGHLQSNKVRKTVQLVSSIDSIDSVELAGLINREAVSFGRKIRALVEVNTSDEPQKYGISLEMTVVLVEQMLRFEHLDVAGVMTVGPNVSNEEAIRHSFGTLREVFEEVRAKLNPPRWNTLSMGMSGDYEVAIEEGATEIRLGTALFGSRRDT